MNVRPHSFHADDLFRFVHVQSAVDRRSNGAGIMRVNDQRARFNSSAAPANSLRNRTPPPSILEAQKFLCYKIHAIPKRSNQYNVGRQIEGRKARVGQMGFSPLSFLGWDKNTRHLPYRPGNSRVGIRTRHYGHDRGEGNERYAGDL